MADRKDKVEAPKPVLTNYKKTLEKLSKLEEKLVKLREFHQQSEQLQENRKKLLEQLSSLSNEIKRTESKTTLEEKRVKFASMQDSKNILKKTSRTLLRPSVVKVQKSKSLHDLLSNLSTWHGEVEMKKSEIEGLKIKKQSTLLTEKDSEYERMIKNLEAEKDELHERILNFVLQNISEGRQEYHELIVHLEGENKEMEDKMSMLQSQVEYLKEINIALMRENEHLRQAGSSRLSGSISLQELQAKCRNSMITAQLSKSSTFLPESAFYRSSSALLRSPSVQRILDMEKEDKLSLDMESVDSFTLDKQIATWKMDDDSLNTKVKILGQEFHEMEVTHMKLNLLKRYVRKHGTKNINRDTFVHRSQGLPLWR